MANTEEPDGFKIALGLGEKYRINLNKSLTQWLRSVVRQPDVSPALFAAKWCGNPMAALPGSIWKPSDGPPGLAGRRRNVVKVRAL